jgi:hypothetical protein
MASAPSSGATNDPVIVLKVDSDKLPKSSDLKAYLFASTLAASATDQEIRIVARGAFPNLSLPVDLVPVAALTPAVQTLLKRAQEAEAPAASPAPAAGAAPAAAGGNSGADGSAPAGPSGPSRPGSGGGRRGRP